MFVMEQCLYRNRIVIVFRVLAINQYLHVLRFPMLIINATVYLYVYVGIRVCKFIFECI